jgi:hypothetical protein
VVGFASVLIFCLDTRFCGWACGGLDVWMSGLHWIGVLAYGKAW